MKWFREWRERVLERVEKVEKAEGYRSACLAYARDHRRMAERNAWLEKRVGALMAESDASVRGRRGERVDNKLLRHARQFVFTGDGNKNAVVGWEAATQQWKVVVYAANGDLDLFTSFSDLYVATGYAEGMVKES